MYGRMVRVAAAQRYGCFDQAGYDHAIEVVQANHQRQCEGTNRPPQRTEISDAIRDAIRLVESKDDATVAAELGPQDGRTRPRGEAQG
jgi:hypothetical protein